MVSSAILAALGTLAYTGINTVGYAASVARVNKANAEVRPPVGMVSINVPAYREDSTVLERCFQSLQNQNIVHQYPDMFETVFTGVQSDPITDFSTAKRYADKMVLADHRGKMFGKQEGIKASSGDIIISVDSDCQYGPNWLNLMLEPYRYSSVVATTASSPKTTALEAVSYLLKHLYYSTIMLGRGSTHTKQAYYDSGGYDLTGDYDQYTPENLRRAWYAEELEFRTKLDAVGTVVYRDAPMIHTYDCYDVECTDTNMAKGRGLRRALQRGKHAYE